MVTNSEIKSFIYKIIKGSELETEIVSNGGSIYRDSRPTNSNKEDVVISILSNRNAQFQPAIANVNIYVPDIERENTWVENGSRIKTLESKANQILKEVVSNDYHIKIDTMHTFKVNEVNEHCINCRLEIIIKNF